MAKRKKKSSLPQKSKSGKTDKTTPRDRQINRNEYIKKYTGPVLIIITSMIMAWWSWGTWCDPMIDFGRELYVPWQITEGKLLYVDIAYFNGPFSPYFNSIWFFLFGVHLRSIFFINFIILHAILFFIYQLLKEIGSRLGATFGCLLIIAVFAYAKYHFIGGYNFIAPYSHEMTHGLLLSLIGLWCLSKYLRQNKNSLIVSAGILLGLVFLTKIEFTVALTIAFILGFILICWAQKEPYKRIVIKLVVFLLGVTIPIIITFMLLYTHMSASKALTGLLGSWVGAFTPELREINFYRHLMGIDNPGMNLKIMIVGFGYLVLLFLPVAVFSLMKQTNKKQDSIIGLALLAGVILTSVFFINFEVSIGPFMLRPLPLVLLSLIIIEALHLHHLHFQYRQSAQRPMAILRITLSIFSLLLLLKIILNTDPSQYGFVLAMPGVIIMSSTLFDWLPAYLEKKGRAGNIFRLFSIGVIIVFVGIHLLWSGFWYHKTNIEIKTDTAVFYADFRGKLLRNIINEIEGHLSHLDTLAVLPEGVMLNFLTQRRNPTPYINFMPPELILFGESNILTAFQMNPPDYIVRTNKSLKEYGFHEVGIGIGIDLYHWIDKNYTLIKTMDLEAGNDLPFTRMNLLRRIQ